MYYFIPSWYSPELPFHDAAEAWYWKKNTGFDDTVNQMRMFRHADEDLELILLGYHPMLRHDLHHQGLMGVKIFSVFDALQGIDTQEPGLLHYYDLEWPEQVEWVHTPFLISAFVHDELYATVDFQEDSYLLWITYFRDQKRYMRNIYDDRGFLSSSIFYDAAEKPSRQEYYSPEGELRFVQELPDGPVTIENQSGEYPLKPRYARMEALVQDVLTKKLAGGSREDVVAIAADGRHDALVRRCLGGQRLVLSFFGNRYDIGKSEGLKEDVRAAALTVTDTVGIRDEIRSITGAGKRVVDISPFDTRLSLGKSMRVRELKVFFPMDHFEDFLFQRAIGFLYQFMEEHPSVWLIVGTDQNESAQHEMRMKLQARAVEMGFPKLLVDGADAPDLEDDCIEGMVRKKRKPRIFVTPYHNEADIARILYDTRLIIDIRDNPDQYIQIAGISAGIPQVNYRNTRYIEHKKNGYMISNIAQLSDALEYYLVGLQHWNEALVYMVQTIEAYDSGSLVKQWKELIGA